MEYPDYIVDLETNIIHKVEKTCKPPRSLEMLQKIYVSMNEFPKGSYSVSSMIETTPVVWSEDLVATLRWHKASIFQRFALKAMTKALDTSNLVLKILVEGYESK